MSEAVKKLRDRRLNVWEEAKKIADEAADQNRAFSVDEQSNWDSLNGELEALDRRVKSILDGEQRAKDTEEAFAKLDGGTTQVAGGGPRTEALRSFLRGELGAPRHFDVMPDGPVNFRDLTKLTNAAGLFTVPTSFYDRLMAHLIETSAILQAGATVLNTGSGEALQVPKTLTHSTGALSTEGSAISESDPTFGQITLGAYKYGVIVQVSRELVEDTGVDLEGYLAMQAGRAIGNAFGTHAITGDGSSKPRGITIDTTLGVTGGTGVTGAFTADNLIDLHYSVIAPYRMSPSCAWLLRDASIGAVRKLKDTTNQYLWQPSLVAGAPDLLLNKPLVADPNMAATALNAKSVVFGDISQYFVRLAGGVRFERSDEFAFNADLVTFRATLRADGALIDLTGAVKHFVGGAS